MQGAFGRSLQDFSIAEPGNPIQLYPGEGDLRAAVKVGKNCTLEEAAPSEEIPRNFVRASFIRFLALGGDEAAPVHERGIWLENAVIGADPAQRNRDPDVFNEECKLDLESCKNVLPLILRDCVFGGDIVIRDARTRTIDLQGSKVMGGIEGQRAFIQGSLYLRNHFEAYGGMSLIDADIRGSLECHNATFGTRKSGEPSEIGTAIFASRAKISGAVFLYRNFAANGPIVFRGAQIGGNFSCSGGRFAKRPVLPQGHGRERAKKAIDCHGAKIGGSVYFRQSEDSNGFSDNNDDPYFSAEGEVCFIDAEVSGSFECHGARMKHEKEEALTCSRMKVGGTVFLHQGFEARGRVSFRKAVVGGNFECSGGRFYADLNDKTNKKVSIDCQGAQIGGSVYFHKHEDKGFFASGEVRFIDADVTGSFEYHGAEIVNPGRDALSCSRIKVAGSVLLIDGFKSEGEVSFRRADVGGNFDASYGHFTNFDDMALSCEDIHVIGAAHLGLKTDSSHEKEEGGESPHFKAHGQVDFSGAHVEGDFDCEGGIFSNLKQKERTDPKYKLCANALNLRRATINGALQLGRTRSGNGPIINGSLDLRGARVRVLIDAEKFWPSKVVLPGSNTELPCHIYMDGFVYEQFGGRSRLDAETRERWLDLQPAEDLGANLKSQPFEQLIKTLRAMGRFEDAQRIAVLKENRNRPKTVLSRLAKFVWGWIGYGYYWHRMLYIAIALWFAGGLIYHVSREFGVIRFDQTAATGGAYGECGNAEGSLFEPQEHPGPGNNNDNTASTRKEYMEQKCPTFYAFKLSADAILPIVGLGEKKSWTFNPKKTVRNAKFNVFGGDLSIPVPERLSAQAWLDLFYFIQRAYGWLFGISLGVVLAKKINRE